MRVNSNHFIINIMNTNWNNICENKSDQSIWAYDLGYVKPMLDYDFFSLNREDYGFFF